MIRFLTAGESHGPAVSTIIEGIPSNLPLNSSYINLQLKRRQMGYGRGLRMKIESDQVKFLSGLRFGKTIGSPISILIENKDWQNWLDKMNQEEKPDQIEKITIPRPGHADLVGTSKYNFNDIRNSIERSSARETAARVAAGSVARKLLEEFGIYIASFVESIGGVYPKENFINDLYDNRFNPSKTKRFNKLADESPVRVLDIEQERKIINKIKLAKKRGDTLGGTFVTFATGLPAGLGSFMHYDLRLDAEIAQSFMSINAVKGVEIGAGFRSAESFGSNSHDEIILRKNKFSRKTNRAGGVEGGSSTGLPIIVRAAMKPIATLMSPIETVDLSKMKKVIARRERSDFVAVPACAVIGEAMLAWTIAKLFLLKFGGDSLEEVRDNYKNYTGKLSSRIKNNFRSI